MTEVAADLTGLFVPAAEKENLREEERWHADQEILRIPRSPRSSAAKALVQEGHHDLTE